MLKENPIERFEGLCRLDAGAYGRVQLEDIRKMTKFLSAGAKVLDVGCGYGLPTSQAMKFFNVSACDIHAEEPGAYSYNQETIEFFMRMRLAQCGGEFRWSSPNHLPYADAEFDGLLLYAVIEHVPDCYKEGFLRECLRVLKPGGKIFMYRAVNRLSVTEKVVAALGFETHGEQVVTTEQMKRIFSNVGLVLLEWGYQGWLPENHLPRTLMYWANRLLCSIPVVRRFAHDFWFVCEKPSL